MAEEPILTPMEIKLKENGKMMLNKENQFTNMWTREYSMENLKAIKRMDLEYMYGLQAIVTKGTL